MASRRDILSAIDRLLTVHAKPRHVESVAALADVWATVLGPVNPDALAYAVDRYLESAAEYFPKPGQLVGLARQAPRRGAMLSATLSEYLEWEGSGWGAAPLEGPTGPTTGFTDCPICGAVPEVGRRIRVVHRAQAHRDRGVPVIGCSDEIVAFYARQEAA